MEPKLNNLRAKATKYPKLMLFNKKTQVKSCNHIIPTNHSTKPNKNRAIKAM